MIHFLPLLSPHNVGAPFGDSGGIYAFAYHYWSSECSIADAASELPQSSLLSPGRGRQLPKGKGVVVAGEGREKPVARCCACAACNACTHMLSLGRSWVWTCAVGISKKETKSWVCGFIWIWSMIFANVSCGWHATQ